MSIYTRFLSALFVVSLMPGSYSSSYAAEWEVEDIAGMEVHIYEPETDPVVNDKRALMISLHGCAVGTNGAQWMQDMANWEPTADKYGMVVVLPAAPDGGAYGMNCWDWKPTDHTRDNYYNKNIFQLVESMLNDSNLNVDPDQVYITGLSSGGGQALVVGCLAPDVFAGVGLNAGPPVGNGSIDNFDVNLIADTCEDFAGDNSHYFDSQIMSVLIGSDDQVVPPLSQQSIAEAMSELYYADSVVESQSFPSEWSTAWSDGEKERVVLTIVDGMSHAWAAGGGEGDDYADLNHINYPAHITEWLFNNNKRTAICTDNCYTTNKITVATKVNSSTATIYGYIRGGEVNDITINILDTITLDEFTYYTELKSDESFSYDILNLEDGDYEATVISSDGTMQNTGIIRITNTPKTFNFFEWIMNLFKMWFGG